MVEPIKGKMHSMMNGIAQVLDETFNGVLEGDDRKIAFVLITANFGDQTKGGCANYISNANHEDMVLLLKGLLARFEDSDGK